MVTYFDGTGGVLGPYWNFIRKAKAIRYNHATKKERKKIIKIKLIQMIVAISLYEVDILLLL